MCRLQAFSLSNQGGLNTLPPMLKQKQVLAGCKTLATSLEGR